MNVASLLVAAIAVAGGSDDIVLLNFTASRCAPCQQMEPVVQRLLDEGYPVQNVDVDRYRRLADEWNVRSIPCFVITRGGREIDRLVGVASFDRLVRMFHQAGFRPGAFVIRGQSPRSGVAAAVQSAHDALWTSSARENVRNVAASTETGQPAPAATADMTPAEQRAGRASVRIRVEDAQGISFGSGTIIHVHNDEALVLTCGHLFRESQGKTPILVDVFAAGQERSVAGQLIAFEAQERDLALVAIRPGIPVEPVPLHPEASEIRDGMRVFSWGYDRGGPPRLLRSHVNSVDRYVGRTQYLHTIQAFGDPVDGRSGGGLFDEHGRLIGVCYAADPTPVEEGLYMGVRTIKQMLDELNLSFVYQATQNQNAVATHSTTATTNTDTGSNAAAATSQVPAVSEASSSGATVPSGATATAGPTDNPGMQRTAVFDSLSNPRTSTLPVQLTAATAKGSTEPGPATRPDSDRADAAPAAVGAIVKVPEQSRAVSGQEEATRRLLSVLQSDAEVLWVIKPAQGGSGEVFVLDSASRSWLIENLLRQSSR
jgi:hypothetical protein